MFHYDALVMEKNAFGWKKKIKVTINLYSILWKQCAIRFCSLSSMFFVATEFDFTTPMKSLLYSIFQYLATSVVAHEPSTQKVCVHEKVPTVARCYLPEMRKGWGVKLPITVFLFTVIARTNSGPNWVERGIGPWYHDLVNTLGLASSLHYVIHWQAFNI